VGEAELQDPLPWDRVPPSSFAREDHVSPFLHELRARADAREAKDKDLAYLREDISQLKKSLATKTVSLNEADRREEKAEAKGREEARKREHAARREGLPATYEITLKNADTPGLPAPAIAVSSATGKLSNSPAAEAEDVESGYRQSDPILRETERILADYLALMHQGSTLAVAVH
jgi:hypothetical protein